MSTEAKPSEELNESELETVVGGVNMPYTEIVPPPMTHLGPPIVKPVGVPEPEPIGGYRIP